MRNKIFALVGTLLFIFLVVGAAIMYNDLKDDYSPDIFAPQDSAQTENASTGKDEQEDFKAPDFTVYDSEGNEVKLSDFIGKPVVLNFWATWCTYCKQEMPDFNTVSEKYPDVQFLMVNATDGVQETVEKAKQYIADEGFTFDVFYDTDRSAVYAYYVSAFPTTYFIDAEGNLITHANGMLSAEMLEKGIGLIRETAME